MLTVSRKKSLLGSVLAAILATGAIGIAAAFSYSSLQCAASDAEPEGMIADAPAVTAPAAATPGTATRFSPNYVTELLNLRRWQKKTLVVFVAAPDAARNMSVAQGAALWNPHIANLPSVRFTQVAAEADMRVSFVDHGSLPDGAIGRTEVMYRNRDNVIVGATMRIDRTLSSELLAQVAAHEFGHAFGLEGHSVDRTDLMYAHAHLPAAITVRDKNTLLMNYNQGAPRADAKSATLNAAPTVAANRAGVTTVAACCLPSEDFAH